jgi:hypothetical protein
MPICDFQTSEGCGYHNIHAGTYEPICVYMQVLTIYMRTPTYNYRGTKAYLHNTRYDSKCVHSTTRPVYVIEDMKVSVYIAQLGLFT